MISVNECLATYYFDNWRALLPLSDRTGGLFSMFDFRVDAGVWCDSTVRTLNIKVSKPQLFRLIDVAKLRFFNEHLELTLYPPQIGDIQTVRLSYLDPNFHNKLKVAVTGHIRVLKAVHTKWFVLLVHEAEVFGVYLTLLVLAVLVIIMTCDLIRAIHDNF